MNYKTKNIIFPVEELKSYQKGILGILSKVELDTCDQALKEDLKIVYKLLKHLYP